MSTPHSTNSPTPDESPRSAKPAKPYPEYPLTPHPAGQWCKKIRGKLHYFGPLSDPDGALQKYLDQKDALHAGRKPREETEGFTVKQLCNEFLIAKAAARDAGEITARSWQDYKCACDLLVSHFGKARRVDDLGPDDFADLRKKMAKKWGPGTLGNVINRMRVAFKFASDNRLIDRPVVYGSAFKRPSKKTLRIDRARKGPKLFTAEEIRKLVDSAGPALKAMILLGINCGFGNADCGNLPQSVVDLNKAIIDFPRPKTGIPRRAILWPETVQTIREALAVRPEPKSDEHAGLVFITKYGGSWVNNKDPGVITKELAKLLRKLGINGRQGIGFYTLRHTFRTIADEAKDQVATDYIMGHEVANMSAVYRETISDERLKAVSDHVRKWLFGDPSGNAPKPSSDVSDLSDQPEEAESGSQDGEPDSPADERPTLRLYVG